MPKISDKLIIKKFKIFKTVKATSEYFHCDKSIVSRALHQAKISVGSSDSCQKANRNMARIVLAYKSGKSIASIARLLAILPGSVNRILIRNSIKKRRGGQGNEKLKIKVICKNCNKTLHLPPGQKDRSFCSKKCQFQYDVKTKRRQTGAKVLCETCRKPVYFEKNRLKKTKKCFCSRLCYYTYQRTGILVKKNSFKTISCETCGCKKKVRKYIFKRFNTRFCSKKCAGVANSIKMLKKQKKRCCARCGKVYPAIKGRREKYCSMECFVRSDVKRESECHKVVRQYLLSNNIVFTEETKIGKKYADFLVGDKIIEVFGDYWHCNPLKYNKEFYHKHKKLKAKIIWQADKKRIKLLKKSGYSVLIVWERDILHNQSRCFNEISQYLNDY